MKIKLARTRGGAMIHRADCPYIQPRQRVKAPPWQYRSPGPGIMPWNWADDKSEGVIIATIAHFGYLTCKHCVPVGGWHLIGYVG